jgi:hypothetical protein
MLYGTPRKETNLEAWFESMKQWGVKQWMPFAIPDRPCHEGQHCTPRTQSAPFLEDAWPGFKPYIDSSSIAPYENTIREMERLCEKCGMEFWYLLPFPIFPSLDGAVIRKAAPEFFPSGNFTLDQPRLAELLKAEIRALKKALPSLKGINMWMAEGVTPGFLNNLAGEEIKTTKKWELPLLKAFNEVTQELRIGGIFFAHNYLQTVSTHRDAYEMMANFPELILMDDPTWPEEDMQHPFLGYLPHEDRDLLFQTNPVALDFLLDTEYIGEGILPSVYPRWWKHNVSESVRSGVKIAMGRTFFWDDGLTDVNFNRLNAHIFVRLCYDPELDLRQLLGEAAQEMFGANISERLIDILWETEPVIKEVIGVNGIDSFDHSRFPLPTYLDAVYTAINDGMKAVDDLFSPPGTRLYPQLSDNLNNFKQWRWQDKTVSEPVDAYLKSKRAAIDWIEMVLPEVRSLAAAVAPHHRKMFVQGYEMLAAAANGMELFVETAALHYQWARAKTLSDSQARVRFNDLEARFRALAAQVPQTILSYKERMLRFADFLEHDLPRISTASCQAVHSQPE